MKMQTDYGISAAKEYGAIQTEGQVKYSRDLGLDALVRQELSLSYIKRSNFLSNRAKQWGV